MDNKFNILIVGAGLSGIVTAYLLSKKYKENCTIKIIDKRDHIGGNCYTEKLCDINVHKYGAHIFHTNNDKVWKFVNKFSDFNNYINSPIAITEDNEIYNLPFNMNTFSKMFNIRTPLEAQEIINKEITNYKLKNPEINNLEDQAISMVGTTIYNKLIKYYTEKQWNEDCKLLPSTIIKRIPVRLTYNNNYFNDKYQGIPEDGYTKLFENILNKTRQYCNIDLQLNTAYTDTDYAKYDRIYYSGRIDEFFNYKYGKLDFRSLTFKEEYLPNTDNFQGNAVVNYTGYTNRYTRIIEHKHFDVNNKDNIKGTYISYEYPSDNGEPYYPINNERNNILYNKYTEESKLYPSVTFIGRLGKYKYFDMDDAILDCMKTI
jgi:UDP-galactopyranose mutase